MGRYFIVKNPGRKTVYKVTGLKDRISPKMIRNIISEHD